MCFRKKNLDYEILKATSERKLELLRLGANSISIMSLTKKIFPEIQPEENKAVLDKRYEEMKGRVNALAKDELLICEDGIFIESITPEGRVLLDRIKKDRWQRRFMDGIIAVIVAIAIGLVVTYLGHFAGWNN